MKGLNPDTSVTRSLRRYREHSISRGVEDNNDFADRVVSSRNSYLLVMGVRDHNGRKIYVVEHELIVFFPHFFNGIYDYLKEYNHTILNRGR